MNQDQVKEKLLQIEEPKEHFELLFTGKSSPKVDGFYKPEERTIYIHNQNMKDDNQLLYTAIHEYAHHLHVTSSPVPVSNRCHTRDFWSVFHRILEKAEELEIYSNVFAQDEELLALTGEIKEKFLKSNGELMREFGQKLVHAQKLCRLKNVDFSDYADRVLGMGRTVARNIMKISLTDVDTSIGYENMKTVASISNPNDRKSAEEAFKNGQSPDRVKAMFGPSSKDSQLSAEERLVTEKKRIERTIENLNKKLDVIEERLADFGDSTEDNDHTEDHDNVDDHDNTEDNNSAIPKSAEPSEINETAEVSQSSEKGDISDSSEGDRS